MTIWHDFIQRLEADIAESKSFLEPLESGQTHLGHRPAGGEWRDTTQEYIERERAVIANLEQLIERIRKERL